MTIAIDIRPLLEAERSGVGIYTLHLIDALLKSHEHEFVLFSSGMRRPQVPEAWHALPNVRFAHWRMPNKLFNASIFLFRWPRFDRLIKADAFLFPNLSFLAMSSHRLSACADPPPLSSPFAEGGGSGRRGMHSQMALVVHDLSFIINPQWFTWKQRIWHRFVRPRALCCRADTIIAVSENTKRDLGEMWGVPKEKIAVIYPGINDCHPERAERVEGSPRVPTKGGSLDGVYPERSRRARDDKPIPYILYLGNVEPRKNLETLFAAFNDLITRRPDLPHHLILAGRSARKGTPPLPSPSKERDWGEVRPHGEDSEATLRANPRIHFLGYIPEKDKSALYAGASAFVYPSWYEGFGMPPLEAMVAGVPVVASHTASLSEVLGNAALLFDSMHPEQLSHALEAVFTDEGLRTDLIARGRTRASEFTWEKAANEIVKLLSD